MLQASFSPPDGGIISSYIEIHNSMKAHHHFPISPSFRRKRLKEPIGRTSLTHMIGREHSWVDLPLNIWIAIQIISSRKESMFLLCSAFLQHLSLLHSQSQANIYPCRYLGWHQVLVLSDPCLLYIVRDFVQHQGQILQDQPILLGSIHPSAYSLEWHSLLHCSCSPVY